MLSFRICIPASAIRLASSTTGPLTSYNTLSSLVDFENCLITLSPIFSEYTIFELPASLTVLELSATSVRSFLCSKEAVHDEPLLFSGAAASVSSPASQLSSTSSVFARTPSMSLRGSLFPLRYWLMWLLPILTLYSRPIGSARRITSTCLSPLAFIASLSLCAIPAIFLLISCMLLQFCYACCVKLNAVQHAI